MRRKPGALVPLEHAILGIAARLDGKFHGYELAKSLAEGETQRALTAYGTLYRALGRLEALGLLSSEWEDPAIPARENRPGRRLYVLTPEGHRALATADEVERSMGRQARKRKWAPA